LECRASTFGALLTALSTTSASLLAKAEQKKAANALLRDRAAEVRRRREEIQAQNRLKLARLDSFKEESKARKRQARNAMQSIKDYAEGRGEAGREVKSKGKRELLEEQEMKSQLAKIEVYVQQGEIRLREENEMLRKEENSLIELPHVIGAKMMQFLLKEEALKKELEYHDNLYKQKVEEYNKKNTLMSEIDTRLLEIMRTRNILDHK